MRTGIDSMISVAYIRRPDLPQRCHLYIYNTDILMRYKYTWCQRTQAKKPVQQQTKNSVQGESLRERHKLTVAESVTRWPPIHACHVIYVANEMLLCCTCTGNSLQKWTPKLSPAFQNW